MVDTETGEHTEKRLKPEEAVQFYGQMQGPVLVGMEACGNTLWFQRLLAQLGHDLWLGDAGKIRAQVDPMAKCKVLSGLRVTLTTTERDIDKERVLHEIVWQPSLDRILDPLRASYDRLPSSSNSCLNQQHEIDVSCTFHHHYLGI